MLLELLEKFEDLFQPASPEEVEKRIPKDAVVVVVDLYYDYTHDVYVLNSRVRGTYAHVSIPIGTIMVPENPDDVPDFFVSLDGSIYATLEPDWYKPYRTNKNESFEDIFQPLSDDEVEKRAPKYTATITEVDKKYKIDLNVPKRYELSLIPKPFTYVSIIDNVFKAFDDFLNRIFGVTVKDVKYVRTINLHNTHMYNVKHNDKYYSILIRMEDEEVKESFEDLFQPLSDDEVEKRIPKDAVVITVDLYYDANHDVYVPYSRVRRTPAYVAIPVGTIMIPDDENPDDVPDYFVSLDGSIYATLEPDWYKPYWTNE